jgi:hypothetical protein
MVLPLVIYLYKFLIIKQTDRIMESLFDPTSSEPDLLDPALKRQLMKLFTIKAPVVDPNPWIQLQSFYDQWIEPNKWLVIAAIVIGLFLLHRWRWREEDDDDDEEEDVVQQVFEAAPQQYQQTMHPSSPSPPPNSHQQQQFFTSSQPMQFASSSQPMQFA